MARKYIYLYEDSQESINQDRELNNKGAEAAKAKVKAGVQMVKDGTKEFAEAKKQSATIKARDKRLAAEPKSDNSADVTDKGLSDDTSILNDEENADASIVDNKSTDEVKSELTDNDIKNEKQPLKEFIDFYKDFFKN